MISAFFEYRFLQNALLAGILASIVCGIIGVIVIEKKLVTISGGIAHTAYGGVGLGYLLNFEPIIGAFIFTISAAIGIGFLKRKGGVHSDVIVGMFWPLGMALGIVFIALMPGYPPDSSSYLFGNILSVTKLNLSLMMILTLLVVLIVVALFNYWKAYLFDEQFSFVIGIKTAFLDYLLLILVAMVVVVLIRVTGIIMVMALMTAPAAIASLLSNKLNNRMIYAIILGIFFCIMGLWISYEFNIASGASIVILSVTSYLIIYVIHSILYKMKRMREIVK